MPIEPLDIIDFWLGNVDNHPDLVREKSRLWYGSKPKTDRQILKQFGATLLQAESGNLEQWKTSIDGQLALVILLDQFTRNLNRGTKGAWKNDDLALKIAEKVVRERQHYSLSNIGRVFLYHPFHHAESIPAQEKAIHLYEELEQKSALEWQAPLAKFTRFAKNHRQIVQCFGRFPHRNKILQRESTTKEIEYLAKNNRRYGQ